MKRVFLLLVLVLFFMSTNSQTRTISKTWYTPTGADTTYSVDLGARQAAGGNIIYRLFDAADAVLNMGTTMHPDSNTFDQLVSSDLPYTMADSSVSFKIEDPVHEYVLFKLTRNSVSSGIPFFIKINYLR